MANLKRQMEGMSKNRGIVSWVFFDYFCHLIELHCATGSHDQSNSSLNHNIVDVVRSKLTAAYLQIQSLSVYFDCFAFESDSTELRNIS